ncbi:MAG: fumarylacetoacetate hydrolase family protein [Clostridiales bacterium]|nr:fumarylacetoacetate hydrolase family protein [Clostridiales bacterium]
MKYIRAKHMDFVFWAVLAGDRVKVLEKAPYLGLSYTGLELNFLDVTLLAPCEPSKIVAVGKNYYDHAMELGGEAPKQPIIFIKPSTTVNHPDCEIPYPDTSKRVDYECELAFVIKKEAYRVKKEEANNYIFAYTCLNDVTARDIQNIDGQWTRSKSFNGFAPIGPWLTDELDPSDVKVETRLNGEIKQISRTSKFMWGIPELLEFITDCMTLNPGDVVTTGTPAGIGPMLPGDVVEVEIEGIGVLRNRVIKRPAL